VRRRTARGGPVRTEDSEKDSEEGEKGSQENGEQYGGQMTIRRIVRIVSAEDREGRGREGL
jgi:hypothetical protein